MRLSFGCVALNLLSLQASVNASDNDGELVDSIIDLVKSFSCGSTDDGSNIASDIANAASDIPSAVLNIPDAVSDASKVVNSISDLFSGKEEEEEESSPRGPVPTSNYYPAGTAISSFATVVSAQPSGTGIPSIDSAEASNLNNPSFRKRQFSSQTRDPPTSNKGTAGEFVAYIRKLYNEAVTYAQTNTRTNANQLVTQWLRHLEYNDDKWDLLVGEVEYYYIKQIESKKVAMIDLVAEPKTGQLIKASHFGACMSGMLAKGEAKAPNTNAGDITGWGGDLLTFYGEWQAAYQKNKISGSAFAKAKLANDVDSTFKMRDLIEDVDCYNVAIQIIKNPKLSIADLIAQEYNGGYRKRVSKFYASRFGTVELARNTAKDMLSQHSVTDYIANEGKKRLVTQYGGPGAVQPDDLAQKNPAALTDFLQGFVNRMKELIAQEG